MATCSIFLASSSELKADRDAFEILIRRRNEIWSERGVQLRLTIWEDFLDAVSRTRKQDDYDAAIRASDILVMLYSTKVGLYTAEEFQTAWDQFQATGRPRIYTYFRPAQVSTADIDLDALISLRGFQKRLKEIGHFETVCDTVDKLALHFSNQLDRLANEGFIQVAALAGAGAGAVAPATLRPPPFQALAPAPDHVPRPLEVAALKAELLDPADGHLLPNTVGLHGFGGVGKTTLARLLCADPALRAACRDGILWLTIGRTPPDAQSQLADLLDALTGDAGRGATLAYARARLAAALAGRAILLVIDDVWDAAAVGDLLDASIGCARLVTTRDSRTLPFETRLVDVGTMQDADALQLVGAGLPAGESARLAALAQRLGAWPVLLRLANRALRQQVIDQHVPLSMALDDVETDLAGRGVAGFDPSQDVQQRQKAVEAMVGATLERLSPAERSRYAELAMFPQGVPIPVARAAELWALTGGLEAAASRRLVTQQLDPLALVEHDGRDATLRLHDVLRGYLLSTLPDRASLHLALVRRWGESPSAGDAYAWRWVAWHQAQAALASAQPARDHLARQLVGIVTAPAWQALHEATLADLPAMRQTLAWALDAAVADDVPAGVPLIVEAAHALLRFGREHQRPEPLFALAREGALEAAHRRSMLFTLDDHWRHAMLIAIAWAAAESAPDAARRMCDELQAELGPQPALHALMGWVRAGLFGEAAPLHPDPMPAMAELMVPEPRTPATSGTEGTEGTEGKDLETADKLIEHLLRRVGGGEYDRDFLVQHHLDPNVQNPDPLPPPRAAQPPTRFGTVGVSGSAAAVGLVGAAGAAGTRGIVGTAGTLGIAGTAGVGGVAGTAGIAEGVAEGVGEARYLAEVDGPCIVAYAKIDRERGSVALARYLSVYTNYGYAEYRFSTLWLLLDAVVRFPDPAGIDWVRNAVLHIVGTALGGGSVEYERALPVAVDALRAAGTTPDAADARQRLRDRTFELIEDAAQLKPGRERDGSDIWAHHKRDLLAHAEALGWLLGEGVLAGQALDDAAGLADSGFAGYQAPACEALAESQHVCHGPGAAHRPPIDAALEWAQRAAHNVQDPTFCARMTARVHALRQNWWTGFVLDERVPRLLDAVPLPELAALHRVGRTYPGRRADAIHWPDWASDDRSFDGLARLYQRPKPAFLRLNGADRPLDNGETVAVPDPGFVPPLAARLAAEILACAGTAPLPLQHLRWLRALVPLAVPSPTALDAVLARLVLAQGRRDTPLDAGEADALARVLPAPAPAEDDAAQAASSDPVARRPEAGLPA